MYSVSQLSQSRKTLRAVFLRSSTVWEDGAGGVWPDRGAGRTARPERKARARKAAIAEGHRMRDSFGCRIRARGGRSVLPLKQQFPCHKKGRPHQGGRPHGL